MSSLLKKQYKFFFIAAVVGIVIPDLNKFFLAKHLQSGALGVITNTVPLFIYPLAIIMREEEFSLIRLLGVILGVIGIFLIITGGVFFGLQLNIWALFALISPLCYAVASIYIVRNNPRDCSPTELCFGMLCYSALLLLPSAIVVLPQQLPIIFSFDLALVITLEIVLTTLGYVLLFMVLRKAGSVCYSLTDGVVAITSLFLGAIFFAEKFFLSSGIGILLILCGIAVVVKNQIKMVVK